MDLKSRCEFSLELLAKDPWILPLLPSDVLTLDLCNQAVVRFPSTFQYVPDELKTVDLCLEAVRRDGNNLCHVSTEMMTPEVCLAAVTQNGHVFFAIPHCLLNPEICFVAATQNPDLVTLISERVWSSSEITFEMCQRAIKSDPEVLRFITKCPELDFCAILELGHTNEDEKKHLDELIGLERRQKAFLRLDEEMTKGAK